MGLGPAQWIRCMPLPGCLEGRGGGGGNKGLGGVQPYENAPSRL